MPARSVDVNTTIMALLESGPKPWAYLQSVGKLSKGALSVHLRALISAGLIQTNVDDTKRPPSTLYAKNPTPPKHSAKIKKAPFGPSKVQLSAVARNLRDPESRKELVRLFVILNGIDQGGA